MNKLESIMLVYETVKSLQPHLEKSVFNARISSIREDLIEVLKATDNEKETTIITHAVTQIDASLRTQEERLKLLNLLAS